MYMYIHIYIYMYIYIYVHTQLYTWFWPIITELKNSSYWRRCFKSSPCKIFHEIIQLWGHLHDYGSSYGGLPNFPTRAAQHSYDTLCTSGSHTGCDTSRPTVTWRYTLVQICWRRINSEKNETKKKEDITNVKKLHEIWIVISFHVKRFQWPLPLPLSRFPMTPVSLELKKMDGLLGGSSHES